MNRALPAFAALVLLLVCPLGCRRTAHVEYVPQVPSVSLRDFVNDKLRGDAAFRTLIEGVDQAARAFNLASDTPAEELEEGTEPYQELVRAIDAAHDAYRRYQSWGRPLQSSQMRVSSVRLTDTQQTLVPLAGSSILVRVAVEKTEYLTVDKVTIESLETARGKTVVTFDFQMNPTVVPDFRVYLVGDRVDVTGAARMKIKRGAQEPVVPPAPKRPPLRDPRPVVNDTESLPMMPTELAPSPGCTKDTDCKGDRICERGACVSPPQR